MTETKQVKLSKLFLGDRFSGHALSVDGRLLNNQESLVITPTTGKTKLVRVTVTFICDNNMIIDAPDIHVK
ncbi:hypothetical protein [Providencia rettgeri]|uniref:hypothetical protein n=1 Tax=Providencia rettgeri TaxID=587 RepID=UPI0025A7B3A1|nr:hypothetical protein [Providencia rettgeri]ELR5224041.1 hypothetical protein [Providencia rettgeri]ELY3857566.1 hypothetical protein [Providencia rettgeri]MDX7324417.1 hypothetical protein [Providencia rettgeri]